MMSSFAFMVMEAWRALGSNRLRTLLTMLGMIIGVAAVVLMLAVGSGAQYSVNQSIAAMGSNLFIVLSGAQTSGGRFMGMGTTPTLTLEDAQAISQLSNVAAVAPVVPGSAQIVFGGNNWSTGVSGTMPGYLSVHNWPLAYGRNISESDVRTEARVAILGQTVAMNLFGGADPVGKIIRISGYPYLVIGLLSVKGQSLGGQDQDDTVLIPVTTALHQLFGSQFVDSVRFIMAQAASLDTMTQVQDDMQALLRQRHHLRGSKPDDFAIRNLTQLAQTASDTARIMSLLLGAIASISLIVGGIGIMNIMLVSVTERTREIGIRMAVGARRHDILLQFLLESIFISVSGCLIGVCLGVGGAYLVMGFTHMTVIVTGFSIALAFIVAAAIGIFFGFYPARIASLMKPIDALRFQ
ncbi:MAG TPA: ABC transporter permease [Gammaproteobacteria bacterium]|nr:ABC transporter permease [Gammaproteobacteria bacterium]